MLVAFVGIEIGFGTLASAFVDPAPIQLPDDVVAELKQADAVVSNAGNPLDNLLHDSILVQPDDRLEFVLRPNVQIQG